MRLNLITENMVNMVYSTQQEILYDIRNSHCHPQRKMQDLHFIAH